MGDTMWLITLVELPSCSYQTSQFKNIKRKKENKNFQNSFPYQMIWIDLRKGSKFCEKGQENIVKVVV
jgi:hypothetical protein